MRRRDTVERIYITLIVVSITLLALIGVALALAAWVFSMWGASDV